MTEDTSLNYTKKIAQFIDEVERYESLKKELVASANLLFSDYQGKRISYFEYKKRADDLLKGQTKKYWIEYYNSYIYSILKKIEYFNSKIFYEVYTHRKELRPIILAPKQSSQFARETKETTSFGQTSSRQIGKKFDENERRLESELSNESQRNLQTKKIFTPPLAPVKKLNFIQKFFAKLLHFEDVKKETEEEEKQRKNPFRKRGLLEGSLEKKGKPTIFMSKFEAFKNVVGRLLGIQEEGDVYGEENQISKETRLLRTETKAKGKREDLEFELAPTMLAEEARRIKNLLSKQDELHIYQPGFFASVANVTIKKVSIFFIENFPDLFRYLYNALRKANIQVLSNTYVNIMFLSSFIAAIISFFFFLIFFAFGTGPWYTLLLKPFIMSIIIFLISIVVFYMYPFNKITSRNRNIRANLAFAIEHMAAVAGSGVSPTKMFKLIAQAKEYGEVSIELEKIVEYIELFGYDFLTALRSVAVTSPSEKLKELFDGMVSSTESGGDLRAYLQEKSKEAMLDYDLERQKYQETISTYSDIYTGLLIAAPLFFVASLSLVSLLGGSVGAFGVDTLIIFGTYVALPVMNVLFIMFIALTQPEV